MPIALLLIDHGSKLEQANQMLAELAELLREKRKDLIVRYAHMTLVQPDIDKGLAECLAAGATEIIVHPFMLFPGSHASMDVPWMIEEAAKKINFTSYTITDPLGIHPKLIDIILERAGLIEFRDTET